MARSFDIEDRGKVGIAALGLMLLTLVACQGHGAGRLIGPTSKVAPTATPASAPTPAPPKASPQFELPPTGPQSSVVLTGPGLVVIAWQATSNTAPRLFRNSESGWKDVTPPTTLLGAIADVTGQPDEVQFGGAALNPSYWWVLACHNGSYPSTLLQTTDGGASWQALPVPGSYSCDESVQLLAPGVGVHIAPSWGYGAGDTNITDVTFDDGQHWIGLYMTREHGNEPQVTPISFAGVNTAFSGGGFTAFSNIGRTVPGWFEVSRDGGRTWIRTSPPSPGGPEVRFDIPTFDGAFDGILPVLGGTQGNVRLQFDRTIDAGRSWQPAGFVKLGTGLNIGMDDDPYQRFPQVSIPNQHTWWVIDTAAPVTVHRTVDGGRSWTTLKPFGLPSSLTDEDFDVISPLFAVDAEHAFVDLRTTRSGPRAAYETNDGGRTWDLVPLPPR